MEIKTILPPVGDRHSGKSLPRWCLLSVGLGTRLSGTALACRWPRVRPEHARINTATSNPKTRGRCREDVEKRKPQSLFGPPHHDFLDTPQSPQHPSQETYSPGAYQSPTGSTASKCPGAVPRHRQHLETFVRKETMEEKLLFHAPVTFSEQAS